MNKNSSKRASKSKSPKKSKTPKKTSKSTPKKTPQKSRNPRQKALPKSPISESMRQLKINEIFKPKTPLVATMPSMDSSQPMSPKRSAEPAPVRLEAPEPKRLNTRKEMSLSPIFNPQKRYSLRNSNKSTKSLKINELFDKQNESMNESKANELYDTAEELIDVSDQYVTANEFMELDANQTQNDCKSKSEPKKSKNVSQTKSHSNGSVGKVLIENRETNQRVSLRDTSVGKANKMSDNLSDDDLEPVFKRPEHLIENVKNSPKQQKSAKYVDKEKENKMKYILKNLSRIQTDEQMLNIQSIDALETQPSLVTNEEINSKSNKWTNIFKGIDIFVDFIPKSIAKYLKNETNTENINTLQNLKSLYDLPLNRLLQLIPIIRSRLEECERQSLISHIITCVSSEEQLLDCNQIESKINLLFTENDFEIHLSMILSHFYETLERISLKLINSSDSQQTDNQFKCLLIVLKIMVQVLNNCSFAVEGIDIEEELVQLLLIVFGLGVDYRIVNNIDWIMILKQLLSVIAKHIFLDECKAIRIIQMLSSFCISNQKLNIGLSLQIVSLFPLNLDFELKRKFCISIIRSFAAKDRNNCEIDFNLNAIQSLLSEIDWKSLSLEDIHSVLQLIGLSLDLPNDLIDFNETISDILKILCFEVNSLVPKASDSEFSEIHKILMILRSKVNVSKRK